MPWRLGCSNAKLTVSRNTWSETRCLKSLPAFMAGRYWDRGMMPCCACFTIQECARRNWLTWTLTTCGSVVPTRFSSMAKGAKERTCPLWTETIAALKSYLEKRDVRLDDATPLFINREGNRLTRFGVRYIIAHHVSEAAKTCPSLLTRRVTPHTIRHTTAMHLLQSNVDLNMIRSWLGHASIETTNGYVEIDLEMKRKTLQSSEN